MATKNIFSIDGSRITQFVKDTFGSVNQSKFVATSKTGKNITRLPLLLVIIIAIVFPVTIIAAIVIGLLLKINISIVKESFEAQKILDK